MGLALKPKLNFCQEGKIMLNFIIGYLIAINILPMILIYIDYTFNLKIKEDILDFIYVIIALIGGSIGIIITSKMFMYKRDTKTMKNIVPLILLIEFLISFAVICKINGWNLFYIN